MKIELILHRVFERGRIVFELPRDEAIKERLKQMFCTCAKKHGDYVKCVFEPPYQKRTTGRNSQNHHLNGHILQICEDTGNDYDTVKDAVKQIAVEQLGYPYTQFAGRIIPKRERDCTTEECAKLIEAVHYLAGELGIFLEEK